MKKLSLAVAIAGAIGATGALANYDNQAGFQPAYLVPKVFHNGSGDTTAIGVIWSCATNDAKGRVYWAFFDANSDHVTDGQFEMTKNDFHGLVWSDPNVSGLGTAGLVGYMVLAADRDPVADGLDGRDTFTTAVENGCISVQAFHVNSADDDVEYVPTVPLEIADFLIGTTGAHAGEAFAASPAMALGGQTTDPIDALNNAADAGDTMYMRYSIDGVQDNDIGTEIVLWSAGHPNGNYTIDMFDDEQQRKSVTVNITKELNLIDPEKIIGAPPDFKEGFLLWDNPAFGGTGLPLLSEHDTNKGAFNDKKDGDGFFSYSRIFHSGFKAKQAILNGFLPDGNSGGTFHTK